MSCPYPGGAAEIRKFVLTKNWCFWGNFWEKKGLSPPPRKFFVDTGLKHVFENSIFQAFKTYAETLIVNENEFFGNDIVELIIFCFESQSAPILHALAADEAKYGSRRNSPHWKMLRSLTNDRQVSVLKHFFFFVSHEFPKF